MLHLLQIKDESVTLLLLLSNGPTLARHPSILTLDAPSSVDTTSGTVFDQAINASANFTLVLPKERLRAAGVEDQVGELYLTGISVLPELYAKTPLNLTIGRIFAKDDTVLFG